MREVDSMDYIQDLKKLINGEMIAAIQYKTMADSVVGDKNLSYIQSHCEEHYAEELEHYTSLVNALMQREDTPSFKVEDIIKDALPSTVEMTSNNCIDVAKFFSKTEDEAIKAYLDFHEKIKDEDPDLDDIIVGIISDEREHKLDFDKVLNNDIEDKKDIKEKMIKNHKRRFKEDFDYEPQLFYGIPGIEFIWHGEWADPELKYKGKLVNYYMVEDTLWEDYREDCKEEGIEPDEDKFGDYVRDRAYYVKDLIDEMEGEYFIDDPIIPYELDEDDIEEDYKESKRMRPRHRRESSRRVREAKTSYDLLDGTYKPWSGAVKTWERLEREGLLEALDRHLDDIYPEGLSESTLNNILWFDGEKVYETLTGHSMYEEDEDFEESLRPRHRRESNRRVREANSRRRCRESIADDIEYTDEFAFGGIIVKYKGRPVGSVTLDRERFQAPVKCPKVVRDYFESEGYEIVRLPAFNGKEISYDVPFDESAKLDKYINDEIRRCREDNSRAPRNFVERKLHNKETYSESIKRLSNRIK